MLQFQHCYPTRMKRLVLLLLLVLPMVAQVSDQSVVQVTVDPTGACGAGVALRYNRVLNKMWGCVAGVWTVVAGGGASGTINCNGAKLSRYVRGWFPIQPDHQ